MTKLLTCVNMSKKLGAQFLARMEAAKEGKRTAVEDKSPPKNPKKIKICIDLTAKPETAEDYLNKVLGTSSKQDRLFEFLKFRCATLLAYHVLHFFPSS